MRLEVTAPEELAGRAADVVAEEARRALTVRGAFTVAFSGGRTPARMLRALAGRRLPWDRIHVLQVDERAAPDGDADRNLTMLRTELVEAVALPPDHVHPMPVTAPHLDAAADDYAATLARVCGAPAVLDLVHLGLGADGHTASLVPGDRALAVDDRDVAATGVYAGHRRLTLTYPALNRARRILWLVAGGDKAAALARLVAGDTAIPAGRVARTQALVLTDVVPATASGV